MENQDHSGNSHFEYIVIGGGKAGKTLAIDLASDGRKVALIEKGMIGGSCINVACIPTKTMIKSAKVADLMQRASGFGVGAEVQEINFKNIRSHKRTVVGKMVKKNRNNFEESGMTLIIGTARFTGERELNVELPDGNKRRLTGDKIFINTGTRPAQPQVNGLGDAQPLDSETIQELDHLPEHLIILGGGTVGCEFAQMFRRFGSRVTLIERGETFLPREDRDIADQIHKIFDEDGIDILLGATVTKVSGKSGESVQVSVKKTDGEQTIEGSDVLMAMGRVPNTEELNTSTTGVELDEKGFIKVNDRLETTADNIWALGDVNGGPQFTHVSLDDYRIVKANLSGEDRNITGRLVPYTLFTDPELGRVGLTEDEAREQGFQVRVARLSAAEVPRAVTSGETRGVLKAVVDADTDKILGVAILAAQGGEVMSVVQVAMVAGMPATVLKDMVFSHPVMAEGLNNLFAQLDS